MTEVHNSQEEFIPCQIIRYLGKDKCVVRLSSTGAVIPITLSTPLDAARAALATALTPAPAEVRLGEYNNNDWFIGCELQNVQWTMSQPYPAQQLHRKRPRKQG